MYSTPVDISASSGPPAPPQVPPPVPPPPMDDRHRMSRRSGQMTLPGLLSRIPRRKVIMSATVTQLHIKHYYPI